MVSGVAPSLDLLPGSVATVLTREELGQRAPQRLYQALELIAGASKLGDGVNLWCRCCAISGADGPSS